MKVYTTHHAALLGALRGERLVPKLFQRLSQERYEVSEDEQRALSDWPDSLIHTPGWAILEPALETPSAWPDVWHQAIERGFPPVCDHHHALLLGRLTERFLSDQEYELARWAWEQTLGAWRRVMVSEYPSELLRDLLPEDSEVEPGHRRVVTELLDAIVTRRSAALRDALRLDDGARAGEQLQRRQIRFAWSALGLIQDIFSGHEDAFGTLQRATQRATQARNRAVEDAVARFTRMLNELDLSTAQGDALLAPFAWVAEVFEVLGAQEIASCTVVREVVELGWTLRRTGREDEIDDYPKILAITNDFNVDLQQRLLTGQTFGHHSKAADFLVFQGEMETDEEKRKEIFTRGVEVCPGHRNSAMLLSYEHLALANTKLLALSILPAVSANLPLGRKNSTRLFEEATAHIQDAEDAYPHNKDLEEYRERLKKAAERLGFEPQS